MTLSRDYKNVGILAACQALFMSGMSMQIILGGLVGATMHKVDENVAVHDICALSEIYEGVLARYFPDKGT